MPAPLLGIVDRVGWFVPAGRTEQEMRDNPSNPHLRAVSHDYLQTMGARLVSGRWFEPTDDAAAAPVIIVNRSVVRRLFNNENPVGQLVHLDGRMDLAPQESSAWWTTCGSRVSTLSRRRRYSWTIGRC